MANTKDNSRKIEQEFNKKLIFENNKGKTYFEHNVSALLRGDSKSRAEYYSKLFQVGAISPNEIRRKENMNDEANGDSYYVPMNMLNTKDKVKVEKPAPKTPIENEEPKE